MSDEVPQEAEAEEIEIKSKKTREAAEQSRALNTLTDHVRSDLTISFATSTGLQKSVRTPRTSEWKADGCVCRWKKRS